LGVLVFGDSVNDSRADDDGVADFGQGPDVFGRLDAEADGDGEFRVFADLLDVRADVLESSAFAAPVMPVTET
jgi:hypothetical protein